MDPLSQHLGLLKHRKLETAITMKPSMWQIFRSAHLHLDKMATISSEVVSDAFLWMKSFVFYQNFTEVCS